MNTLEQLLADELGIRPDDPEMLLAGRLVDSEVALVKALVARRTEVGLSRREVARRIGVEERAITRMESAVTASSNMRLIRLYAQVVGVDIGWTITPAYTPPGEDQTTDRGAPAPPVGQ